MNNDPSFIFAAVHVFLGICAVVVFGLAIWLAYTIVSQETVAIGHHEVDENHHED